ncbi:hypothetical protein EN871_12485 [bacterium M00.F.Ca.ET.228.01.1.1]|uniref:hypothetical protein n=2 Tax=Pseudomonadota TaxID=1224 RepID=UPI0010931271|nr:hypothetical protein [Paraburkholderia phenoliruptrix]TGP43849.1 hypothetical protein EN871_12485 [bacterium M00.F.Ca.ET.228.01.1.1]TGS01512.1 hypothetical protein EN834_12480 [bacterium M00.F.Ca.ET.191.01.1.1]TGU08882.1 hypothetical protein EN798_07050 [bacterium M00.F.Ca.ET.155.01.1.1]MBW0449237.1 hypothetical protein [Paraburkholderia phenoliruptrix]MBW9097517.1 hypothetical protein [Paraburkholderia phenoliruptrix]
MTKLIKHVFYVAVLFSTAMSSGSAAEPSLCSPKESVIFSCSTAASKVIALCMDEHTQLITYRYGKPQKIELSYSARQESEKGFFYNHYFRASVDYLRVAFSTAGYEYSIFRNYDATEAALASYGVAVSRNGNDKAQINCHSRVVDNMTKIIKHLKCDNSSALGCS